MSLPTLSRRESLLLALFALLVICAVFGPSVRASGLAWRSLPDAMDILSSIPLAAIGIWGLRWLNWLDRAHERMQDAAALPQAIASAPVNALDCAWIFFAGLLLTGAASVFFHLQPGSLRLAADRAGMAVAIAGLVGFAVCERVSARAGWPAAWFTLASGLLAAAVGHRTGNALPWALVQFGGLALMLALSLARPLGAAIGLRLGWIVFFFMLAMLFELADSAIYQATHQLLSGYSLRHLTAAVAALPVLTALQAMGRQAVRHNSSAAAIA